MLVLTRREGESLRIGPDVRVTIVTLAGGQVRIGVEAPDSVFVHREEVWKRLEDSNREAARGAASLPMPDGAVADRAVARNAARGGTQ